MVKVVGQRSRSQGKTHLMEGYNGIYFFHTGLMVNVIGERSKSAVEKYFNTSYVKIVC